MDVVFGLIWSPRRAFDRLRGEDVLVLGMLLMLVRWTVTPAVTVVTMYQRRTGMALIAPFGIEEHLYRYYEIMWYGPFGFLMTLCIVGALYLLASRHYRRQDVTVRRTFEIVAVSFFSPWVFTVPGDYALIVTDNAQPVLFVAYHLCIVAWQSVLVGVGFRRLYGLSTWRSTYLGLASGMLFLGLGGLLIR